MSVEGWRIVAGARLRWENQSRLLWTASFEIHRRKRPIRVNQTSGLVLKLRPSDIISLVGQEVDL
jgi:hypothetical protein